MIKSLLRHAVKSATLRVLRVHTTYSAAAQQLVQGQAIVCANHVSFLDGLIVALASPKPLTFGVDADFSKRSTAARAGMSALAWMGFGAVIPLDEQSPHGLRALAKTLERGESVMLFPEGGISNDGRPMAEKPGVTWLQRRSGAKLVRIQIRGAERSRLFAKAGDQLWPRIDLQF